LEGSNVVSGVQRLPSSLVVEDLRKTPRAAWQLVYWNDRISNIWT
jgi:hypothetical protein